MIILNKKVFYLIFVLVTVIIFYFLPYFVLAQSLNTLDLSVLQSQINSLESKIKALIETFKTQTSFQEKKTSLQEKKCIQSYISWEIIPYVEEYRLYRNGVIVYQGRNNSFFDSGLVPGRKYNYVVYGLVGGKEGEPSETKEFIISNICPPSPPQLNLQISFCGGNIALNWKAVPSAKIYQLFRDDRQIYQGPLNYFLDLNLLPNKVYQYKIRAGNEGGWGAFSKVFSFISSNVCGSSGIEVSSLLPAEFQREGMLSLKMNYFYDEVIKIPKRNDDSSIIYPTIYAWKIFSNPEGYGSIINFDVKADFSDIIISRIDIFFDKRPWLYLDEIWLIFKGEILALKDASKESLFTEFKRGSIYQLRFDQLNALIKEGEIGNFEIKVKVKDRPVGSLPVEITTFLNNNSVRGVDNLNISHLIPLSGGGKKGFFSRTFRIE